MTLSDIRLHALLNGYENSDGAKADRIYNAFLKTVDAGYWRPGDKLPAEREMARALPVSEGTIQAVMRRLVDAGIVHRSRGRGTFISEINEGDYIFIRFFDDEAPDSGKIKTLNIEIDKVEIMEISDDGPWGKFLKPRRSYIRIVRHLSIGNTFKIFSEFVLDGGRFRPLLDIDPDTLGMVHIRNIINDRFNAPILRVIRNLQLVAATEEAAYSIDVKPGDMMMLLEVLNFTLRDEPIIYQWFFVPPNDMKLNVWDG